MQCWQGGKALPPLQQLQQRLLTPPTHPNTHLLRHPPHPLTCCCSGWQQAIVLWNFVLSAALLAQKVAIAVGLGGLLPGQPGPAGCPQSADTCMGSTWLPC